MDRFSSTEGFNQNDYRMTYNVDIALCIDVTGSMRPILDTVKNNALNLCDDIKNTMIRKGKEINKLRIRIVAFRDYDADGDEAMLVTDFFNMPEQGAIFEKCVRGLKPKGGGDIPEDGLEALAYGIKSKWDKTGMKSRHIIIVWTDAPTHELGYGRANPCYPRNMAADFDELTEWWGDSQLPGVMDQNAKRLLIFAPESHWWSDVSDCWDQVIHFPSKAGKGLEEVDYDTIVSSICNSI